MDTFKQILDLYERGLEIVDVLGSEATDAPDINNDRMTINSRDGWSKVDSGEEAYFNTSDDDEVNDTAMSDTTIQPDSAVVPSERLKKVALSPSSTAILEKQRIASSPSLPNVGFARSPLVDYPDDDDDPSVLKEQLGIKRRSPSLSSNKGSKMSIVISLNKTSKSDNPDSPSGATDVRATVNTGGNHEHVNKKRIL